MIVEIRFESDRGGYVPVLSDSQVVPTGKLASQNAGSTNPGIYYQVGGGGVNGLFASALGAGATEVVNAALVAAYDERFGASAWQRDASGRGGSPLTSFFVPVDPAHCAAAGSRIAAVLYSVGPQLGPQGITDEVRYRDIYEDAFTAVARANATGAGVAAARITMLSTGIYATRVEDPDLLFDTSAALIVDAIEVAAAKAGADFPSTVLVNASIDPSGGGKEVDSFTNAARARGLQVTSAGFDLDVGSAS